MSTAQEKYKVSRYAPLRSYPFFPAILTIQTTHSTSNMAPSLTIRNLTSTPLELKLIERYEAPSSNERKRNATPSAPSAPKLGEHAQSFSQQDADIRIEPFKIHTTDIKATEHLGNETIRLTIESDGQRYRTGHPRAETVRAVPSEKAITAPPNHLEDRLPMLILGPALPSLARLPRLDAVVSDFLQLLVEELLLPRALGL